jgi:IclR family transcriptional regulator, pca regulon regulatory protein
MSSRRPITEQGAERSSSGKDRVTDRQEPPEKRGVPTDNPKNVVNSVVKAFNVLHAFTAQTSSLTIGEVALATGMDRGTAFRLVHTLVSLDYLRPVPSKRFRLTLKCLELGFLALSQGGLAEHAAPLLSECVPEFADAASLGTLDGADVVFLQRVEMGLRRNVDRRPGGRVRAYAAALGHAILAYLPQQQQIVILESSERPKLSERTLTNLDALLERLQQVRKHGYAVSDGENAYGLRTVAVPILDPDGVPVAGVSLTVDAERMSIDALIKSATPRALAIADELSRALRYSADAISVGKNR